MKPLPHDPTMLADTPRKGLPRITLTSIEAALFFLFFMSLMTKARYRLGDNGYYHLGGAEFAISPYDIPFLAIAFVFAYRVCKGDYHVRNDRLNLLIVSGISVNLLSLITSMDREYTLYEVIRQLKFGLFFFWAVSLFERTKGGRFLLLSACAAISVQLIFSQSQLITGKTVTGLENQTVELTKIAGGIVRIAGSFGHPGLLSQFLNLSSCISLVYAITWHGRYRFAAIAAYFVSSALILMSYSRTAIVTQGMLLAFGLFILRQYTKKIVVMPTLALAMILATTAIGLSSVITRFTDAPSESSEIRVTLAAVAMNIFADNPIFGSGLNTFTRIMQEYDPTLISSYWPHPVHNVFLLVAAETGTVGLLVFLLTIFGFLRTGYKSANSAALSDPDRTLAACGLLMLAGISLSGLLGWSWRLDAIQALYWIALAMIAATHRKKYSHQSKQA